MRILVVLIVTGIAWPVEAQERFKPLNDKDAAQRLQIKETALPVWARILADPLPAATAKMLRLDHTHRVANPLGKVESAKIRWIVADANRCDYAKKYAESDLRGGGVKDADIVRLTAGTKGEKDAAIEAFTRKMTLGAYRVTDAEVDQLAKLLGEEVLVALVHTIAHANFQNRIFLALGVQVEKEGPLPPLEIIPAKSPLAPSARPDWKESVAKNASRIDFRPDWPEVGADELHKIVDLQKHRKPRIPLPGPDRLAKLPPAFKERALRSAWSGVSVGYQPELTRDWYETMGAFMEEAKLDLEYSNLYFWVLTRANECFY